MRTFLSFAAAAAFALSPIAAAQDAQPSAGSRVVLSSPESMYFKQKVSNCSSSMFMDFNGKPRKRLDVVCKTQADFDAGFEVGEKMEKACDTKSEGYVCQISVKDK
ncbi:MAG TPA: hypothetical protein VN086_01655 [Candidatus Paceibacterota bacterium]|nr:hypothetical protein [Candidatus Paceibacterota bacterium]